MKKNWPLYSFGLIVVFALKYFYSRAGSDELRWVLAPTAWCVKSLSGITFEYEAGTGFINYGHRFVIAPACAGINFMVIVFAALLFTYLHYMGSNGSRIAWLAVSLCFSYLSTILVNSIRIVFSIFLLEANIYGGWITPAGVHTAAGIAVYFASFFAMYHLAGKIIRYNLLKKDGEKHFTYDKKLYGKMNGKLYGELCHRLLFSCVPPLFWYFSITLGVPLLNRSYVNNENEFAVHSLLVATICIATVLLFCLGYILPKLFRSGRIL